MEPIMEVGGNAVKRLRGCPSGRKALTVRRSGSEEWRRKYGLRWIAESAFSWMKRAFGEYVKAKKFENMVREKNPEGLPIQPSHRNGEKGLRERASKQDTE